MRDITELPAAPSRDEMDDESQQSRDLLQTITLSHQTLIDTFQREGHFQIEYPKSRDGWWRTLFIWEGRSLDLIASPFFLSVLHAVGYCIVQELMMDLARHELEMWEIFFPLVLSTTLSLLLVFRLNRAADRWWTSRIKWGQIIAITRNLVSGLVTHAEHKEDRDRVIQWILTFVIATMERLRDVKVPPKENFAGVLCEHQFTEMVGVDHPPMYAADQARYYLARVFAIDDDTSIGRANRKTRNLEKMETMIDELMICCGAMERIKATPLPIVYVSHLRTFLLLSLLMIPYAWGPSWGWATIPFVTVTSFAWLGIEAASMDAEYPFSPVRRNALDMDSYCLLVIQGTMQHSKRAIQSLTTEGFFTNCSSFLPWRNENRPSVRFGLQLRWMITSTSSVIPMKCPSAAPTCIELILDTAEKFDKLSFSPLDIDVKYMRPDDFDFLIIATRDLNLKIFHDENDIWEDVCIASSNRVTELGHFERFSIFVDEYFLVESGALYLYEFEQPLAEALVRVINGNPNLTRLDICGSYWLLDWGLHLKEMFKVVEKHKGLRTFTAQCYRWEDSQNDDDPKLRHPQYSWLEQLLKRNRNITVLERSGKMCSNKKIDNLYLLNHIYNGSTRLVTESTSALVATAMTESASENFQFTSMMLSNQADILCPFISFP